MQAQQDLVQCQCKTTSMSSSRVTVTTLVGANKMRADTEKKRHFPVSFIIAVCFIVQEKLNTLLRYVLFVWVCLKKSISNAFITADGVIEGSSFTKIL